MKGEPMESSWIIKGVGYLLIALFLGVVLWIVRLKPKKAPKRILHVTARKKRKPIKKRRRRRK